jgi:hypothetical protein
MEGGFFRLDVNTLKITPTQGPATVVDTNGIRAQLIDGILWVTQPAGGGQRNYCGDPATGRARARLPLSGDSVFLTADTTNFYYEPLDTSPAEIARAPIDPRCRSAATATHQQESARPPSRTPRVRSNAGSTATRTSA